jgi:hypothetical protein
MSPSIVMEYIRSRTRELGFGDDYILRLKHILLEPLQEMSLHTTKDFYVLIEMPEDIRIESERGVFDLSDLNLSEQEYEHRGSITITNQYIFKNHLKMIHVIPN